MALVIDPTCLKKFDANRAASRIANDIVSDLVYAPHIASTFAYVADDIFAALVQQIKTDNFAASPIVMETPKRSGLTRPGAILEPCARLLYQLLADEMAEILEQQIDRDSVFSQRLLVPDPDCRMFEPISDSYRTFVDRTHELAAEHDWVLETDVSNYFERIYHHNLINFLDSSAVPRHLVRGLENLLYSFTNKESHGIPQGLFPSDFFGNVYLVPADLSIELLELPFTRFVDDYYIFSASESKLRHALPLLCSMFRKDSLSLNESKTELRSTEDFTTEEDAVQKLFNEAKEEIRDQSGFFETSDYGFTHEWAYQTDSKSESEIELEAVKSLYEQRDAVSLSRRDSIDRFCLAAFAATDDPVAIKDALKGVRDRPHLARDYCRYLAAFVDSDSYVVSQLTKGLLSKKASYDSQRMWMLAALLQTGESEQTGVKECLRILRERDFSEPVRALAAMYSGSHGGPAERRLVKQHYVNEESPYVRAAILYTAKYFPKNERDACLGAWGQHSVTNSLIARTVREMCRS